MPVVGSLLVKLPLKRKQSQNGWRLMVCGLMVFCGYTMAGYCVAATWPVERPGRPERPGNLIAPQQLVPSNPDEAIRELIEKSRLSEAAELIEASLSKNPHNHPVQLSRRTLANAYARLGKAQEAARQLEAFVNYILEDPQQSGPLWKYLPQVLISLPSIHNNTEPLASDILQRSLELMQTATEQNPANAAYNAGLSSVVSLRARGLTLANQWPEAIQLLETELARLRSNWQLDKSNPDHCLRLTYMLKAAIEAISSNEEYSPLSWQLEHRNALATGVQRFPESTQLVREYFSNHLSQIAEYETALPTTAMRMYEEARKDFARVAAANPERQALVSLRIEIERRYQNLMRSHARQHLIGQPAPELEGIQWLNSSPPATLTDRKSVLLFVSPAVDRSMSEMLVVHDIAKSIHPVNLIVLSHHWGETFGQLGFARKEGQSDSNHRSSYLDRIKQEVLIPNQIMFPFGIVPEATQAAQDWGLTEIPLAILLDENGICRQVVSGPDMVKQITAFLK